MSASVMALPSQEIITINIWQILISLCNLMILFLILKRFLYKPVQKMLEARQKKLDDTVTAAKDAESAAKANQKKWSEKMDAAEAEADRKIKNARMQAKSEGEKIVSNAKAEVDAMMRSAKEDVLLEHQKAEEQMKQEIVRLSTQLAGKMLEREISEQDHRQLIDSFIDEMYSPANEQTGNKREERKL